MLPIPAIYPPREQVVETPFSRLIAARTLRRRASAVSPWIVWLLALLPTLAQAQSPGGATYSTPNAAAAPAPAPAPVPANPPQASAPSTNKAPPPTVVVTQDKSESPKTKALEAPTTPSVFKYAVKGFGTGVVAGLASAYLIARPSGVDRPEWKTFALGPGIGALVGTGLGLSMGFHDKLRPPQRTGHFIMRDSLYGVGFGALLGVTVGGLVAISTDDVELVPLGASIGALSGVGVGVIAGVIEGVVLNHAQDKHAHRRGRWAPTMMVIRDERGQRRSVPAVVARF